MRKLCKNVGKMRSLIREGGKGQTLSKEGKHTDEEIADGAAAEGRDGADQDAPQKVHPWRGGDSQAEGHGEGRPQPHP